MANLTMTLTNLPKECGIQIASVKTAEPLGDITKIKLKRRKHGTILYTTIWEKTITTTDDFTFTVKDFNTRSRYSYDYMIMQCEGDEETIGITDTIKCEFDGIYIADDTNTYICVLNPKYTWEHNGTQDTVIETLGSRYPFVVGNGLSDYVKGSVTGIFVPPPTVGNYTQEATMTAEARDYKDSFIAFLKNKKSKTLKTHDGRIGRIATLRNPRELDADIDGAAEISFDFVETSAPIETGVVVVT